ncbi:MAG: hypothetical protein HQL68_11615 [Magnetococcales bacterium]|nr:hypothetical protein [Magnetococcales bacterium]
MATAHAIPTSFATFTRSPPSLDAIKSFVQSSGNNKKISLKDIAIFESNLAKGQQNFVKFKAEGTNLVGALDALVLASGPEGFDFDKRIKQLEKIEYGWAAKLGKIKKNLRGKAKTIVSNNPQHKEVIERIEQESINLVISYLETWRDMRWELMAIQAETEKDEKGPTFNDPDKLDAYLANL